jgi:hypothetical protein
MLGILNNRLNVNVTASTIHLTGTPIPDCLLRGGNT